MMFVLISMLAIAHCTELQSIRSGDRENNSIEPSGQLTATAAASENTAAVGLPVETTTAGRSARQFYPAAAFGYMQTSPYANRRAYKVAAGQLNNKRPLRKKSGRRPRPKRRPAAGMSQARYRRLPMQQMRPQHVNYVDPAAAAVDYYDDGGAGLESVPQPVPFDFGPEREFNRETAAAYAVYGTNSMGPISPLAVAVQSMSGRSRKRPAASVTGYGHDGDVPLQAIVHVPVRVARPAVQPTPTAAAFVATTAENVIPTADLHQMEDKLRRLVHEAMDEHFAARHQELYSDGFDKLQHPVYSAKYKKRGGGLTADNENGNGPHRTTTDATVKSAAKNKDTSHQSSSDADADGSDDRLTLAEISAYMGAKPAETVLSAGGHRYVLSDALQHSYRLQHQQHQQLQQRMYDDGDDRDDHLHHQQQQRTYGDGDGHHHEPQYLRYVSPLEALYELPSARWAYR
ncbi:Hypothetical protein CINCED_3A004764 [Cinara cedri]|uniref:Uncharacterized protein n=1 Tax=Cinara cedri TaxID=506608 RepID=A0A5E4N2B4_9HEMI|nr:Hypothetical protein CINCED_3A004764 [Cinara cedri]